MNRRQFLQLLSRSVPAVFLTRLLQWRDIVLKRHDVQWPVLSLTIDDGFSLYHLETATDLCIKYGFGATFFLNAYGLDVFGYNPKFRGKWYKAGFSFAYHSRFHLWENINWNRKQWHEDYSRWLSAAWESFGSEVLHATWQPYARAPFGAFYDPFLEMCEDNRLIPYGWSSDPQDWVRGSMPKKGDVVLLHARPQDWHQFEWLSKNWSGSVVSLSQLRSLSSLTEQGFYHLPSEWWKHS